LGLIKRRTGDKSGHYDFFRGRLMFPIFSPTGNCLGFGGRALSADQSPKYLNSSDSAVFHKGKVFYGLQSSVKYIREADEIVVVEGYMDWLALAKVGLQNTVAPLGTALTVDHAKVIKRYSNKVLLLFDGDEAGKSAARRSLPILLSEGISVRGLFLPDDLDPDEFIKERSVEELKVLMSSAPDMFDRAASELWQESKGTPSGKVKFMDEVTSLLLAIPDVRLRSLYIDNLARMTDLPRTLIEQSVRKAAASGSPQSTVRSEPRRAPSATQSATAASPPLQSAQPKPDKIDLSKISRTELQLLNVVLLKEVYLKEALAAEIGPQLIHPGCQSVFSRLAEEYGRMPNKFASLSALLADEVVPVESITRHLSEEFQSLNADSAEKLLRDCLKRVKENFLRSKTKELVSGLVGSSPSESAGQLEQIMNIQRNRRQLNRNS
jgi:DNA primase